MRRLDHQLLGPTVFIILVTVFAGIKSEENATDIPFEPAGIRFDMFDLHLCQALYTAIPTSNVAVSPVSVKLILAMLYEAARGDTATELQQTLRLPQTKRESRVKFGAIQKSLTTPSEDYELKIASRIFVPLNSSASYGYQRVLSKYFAAGMQSVDFSNHQQAAKIVNDWVSETTNGRIKTMLSPDDPEIHNLVMILANALYFKGLWEIPFPQELTFNGTFHLTSGSSITHEMMNNEAIFHIAESKEDGYKLLRLPYKGGKYSLYIILPNERDGLATVLTKLTPDRIHEVVKQLQPDIVDLTLPKFGFEFEVDLEPILKKLGIEKMFNSAEADFPSISSKSRVYVSRILHKAGLEVNELGSIVHASTVVELPVRIVQMKEIFNVDRPFVFFIKDDTASTIVFAAKVEDPSMQPGQKKSVTSPAPVVNSRPLVYPAVPSRVFTTTDTPKLSGRQGVPTQRPPSYANYLNPSYQQNTTVSRFISKQRTRRFDFPYNHNQFGYNQHNGNYQPYPQRRPDIYNPHYGNHQGGYGYPHGYGEFRPEKRPEIYGPRGQQTRAPLNQRFTTPRAPLQSTRARPPATAQPPRATLPPRATAPPEITDVDYVEGVNAVFGTPPPSGVNNNNNNNNRPVTSIPTFGVETTTGTQQLVDNLFYNILNNRNNQLQ